jgi:flagellin
MTTSAYKGKNVFVSNAGSEDVSMGGRNAEMTFGIGTISYAELYGSAGRLVAGGPNDATTVNLAHLPSDAVAAKKYGFSPGSVTDNTAGAKLLANKTYILTTAGSRDTTGGAATNLVGAATKVVTTTNNTAIASNSTGITVQDVIKVGSSDIDISGAGGNTYTEVTSDNAFVAGLKYEIVTLGSDTDTNVANSDAAKIAAATSDITGGSGVSITVGQQFTVNSAANLEIMDELNSLTSGITLRRVSATNELTQDIEAVQAKVNTARVQAGSQYAAMESAVDYTTDLTAQYELGFNTVNDVNFSMETAHLAKNQILQQAATAMLAQANQGQQGLLQLIQG